MLARFRIVRRVGSRLVNVGVPGMTDALTMHAADSETALANARRVVADTRNLIAIPESN